MPPNRFESEVESFLEGSHGDRTHIKQADHHTVTPLCGTLLLGSDRVADKMAKAAAAAWRTTHGKVVIIGCVSFLSARLWVLGKERYERKQKSQQLIDEFNAACSSYLNVARQAVLNVDVIHDLSEVTKRIQELPSKERPVFSPQIVDLIEEHTRELAEANNVGWNPIESTDDDLFARLIYSLETQRQIFDNAE